ncbi:hypothetical protein CCMA1212_006919 [Trichoderma ghanense]|uniref:Uncharacterized protein n=1 Tax=Trichoderma ghanense TaxID=65468 RepID=A0ABY2H1P8_9HYPO
MLPPHPCSELVFPSPTCRSPRLAARELLPKRVRYAAMMQDTGGRAEGREKACGTAGRNAMAWRRRQKLDQDSGQQPQQSGGVGEGQPCFGDLSSLALLISAAVIRIDFGGLLSDAGPTLFGIIHGSSEEIPLQTKPLQD